MTFSMNVRELVQQSVIPVYGVVENSFGLKLTSIGQSFVGGNRGGVRVASTVMLGFSGSHTGAVTLFNIHSCNSYDKETRDRTLRVLQPHPYPPMNMDNSTLRLFGFDEHTQKLLGQPIKIVETIALADRLFTLEMHYWELLLRPAWFLLQNKHELFFGQALGFTKDELFQILHQCSVVNSRERIIYQYQQELDQFFSTVMNQQGRDGIV